MPICDYCGEEIEFRYVGGRPTPIHINGGWCSGYSTSSPRAASKPFGDLISYVNPNAHCPACGEKVFFYQSPFGGRVFFDDLGWPWPKHGCTDNQRTQTGPVKRVTQTLHKSFQTKRGESLRVFELAELAELEGNLFLKVREVGNRLVVLRTSIPIQILKDQDITLEDLRSAPSFVLRFYDNYRLLEFISGRKRAIATLKLPKPNVPTPNG